MLQTIPHLKKISQQHGYYWRKCLNQISSSLNNFLQHLQIRNCLWPYKTAFLLKREQLQKTKSNPSWRQINFYWQNPELNWQQSFYRLHPTSQKGTNFMPTDYYRNSNNILTAYLQPKLTNDFCTPLCSKTNCNYLTWNTLHIIHFIWTTHHYPTQLDNF